MRINADPGPETNEMIDTGAGILPLDTLVFI
jgi:hypothetical protein